MTELPGMWEEADFTGGWSDVQDADLPPRGLVVYETAETGSM